MKNKQSLNLILLGDPGAGKGTQSAYFANKYNLFNFDMGRELTLLRERSQNASSILAKNYDLGKLAPTKMVRQIIRDRFEKLPRSQGILFSGFPKMVQEARLVGKLLQQTGRSKPLVLYIDITHDEIIRRVLARKGYPGTANKKRAHDSIAGLRNRARYYRLNIKQVVEYFKETYTFAHIDGMGTKTEVRKRIQKAIDFYSHHYAEIYQTTRRD